MEQEDHSPEKRIRLSMVPMLLQLNVDLWNSIVCFLQGQDVIHLIRSCTTLYRLFLNLDVNKNGKFSIPPATRFFIYISRSSKQNLSSFFASLRLYRHLFVNIALLSRQEIYIHDSKVFQDVLFDDANTPIVKQLILINIQVKEYSQLIHLKNLRCKVDNLQYLNGLSQLTQFGTIDATGSIGKTLPFSNIQCLKLEFYNLTNVSQWLPLLTKLHRLSLQRATIDENCAKQVFPKLTHLELLYMNQQWNSSYILLYATHLQVLQLSYIKWRMPVGNQSIGMTSTLKQFVYSHRKISQEMMLFLNQCTVLKECNLSCETLPDVILQSPLLKKYILSRVKNSLWNSVVPLQLQRLELHHNSVLISWPTFYLHLQSMKSLRVLVWENPRCKFTVSTMLFQLALRKLSIIADSIVFAESIPTFSLQSLTLKSYKTMQLPNDLLSNLASSGIQKLTIKNVSNSYTQMWDCLSACKELWQLRWIVDEVNQVSVAQSIKEELKHCKVKIHHGEPQIGPHFEELEDNFYE